ncbi:MAG: glycosyltransferase family 39 protein [Isosphaeraceae bacterium]
MDVADQARWRSSAWVEWWLTVVLGLAAAIAVGFGILLALSREDSEPVESTLLLAIARQLRAGPWELYGPFNAANLLVLIHAPFYYHLAALLAWPLSRVGIEPITAALVAGRFLSVLGLLATLAMAYRLARLDGAPARAGVWAILLVAAVPVMGSMPYSVRPDLLGIAFQTAGVLFVLGALGEDRRRGGRLLAAFAAFALAFCIKQHFIVAAAISVVLCLSAWRRGGVPFKLIERGLLVALGIAAAVYGTEELMTGGRMSRAVFLAARSVGGVHPGSWYRAEIVAIAAVAKSAGLLTLLAAAGLAAAWASPGRGPRALASAGAGLAGMVLVFVILQLAIDSTWLTAAIVTTLAIITPLWIAAGLIRGWREMIGERLDGILWLYVLGETALVVVLFRASTGAWVNYAIQATVFVAVVTGRALGRTLEARPPFRSGVLIAAGALVCLGCTASAVRFAELERRIDRQALATLLQHVDCDPSQVFVVGHPGMNRLHGRLDLVYDEWLYPVFEALGLAQPRAIWLRPILTAGNIRFVVNTSDAQELDGIAQTLPALGYVRKYHVGPFYAWENRVFRELPRSARDRRSPAEGR